MKCKARPKSVLAEEDIGHCRMTPASDNPAKREASSFANNEIALLLDQLNVAPDERKAWLSMDAGDPGYQDMDDDAIVAVMESQNLETQQSSDEQDDESVGIISHHQACRAFVNVLEYLEQQDGVLMSPTATTHTLFNQAGKKLVNSLVQR